MELQNMCDRCFSLDYRWPVLFLQVLLCDKLAADVRNVYLMQEKNEKILKSVFI